MDSQPCDWAQVSATSTLQTRTLQCACVSTLDTSVAGGRIGMELHIDEIGMGLHIDENSPPHMAVLSLSRTALQRQTIEGHPGNDRHRLRAMPPASGLAASGSDKVLKTTDQHLSHVRISNVCSGREPMTKTRSQSAFTIVDSSRNLM
jgi:hypothetical protein